MFSCDFRSHQTSSDMVEVQSDCKLNHTADMLLVTTVVLSMGRFRSKISQSIKYRICKSQIFQVKVFQEPHFLDSNIHVKWR